MPDSPPPECVGTPASTLPPSNRTKTKLASRLIIVIGIIRGTRIVGQALQPYLFHPNTLKRNTITRAGIAPTLQNDPQLMSAAGVIRRRVHAHAIKEYC